MEVPRRTTSKHYGAIATRAVRASHAAVAGPLHASHTFSSITPDNSAGEMHVSVAESGAFAASTELYMFTTETAQAHTPSGTGGTTAVSRPSLAPRTLAPGPPSMTLSSARPSRLGPENQVRALSGFGPGKNQVDSEYTSTTPTAMMASARERRVSAHETARKQPAHLRLRRKRSATHN